MNQDFTQQWLTEIQELREQMAALQSDRDTAWESAQKWRQLYNTEAEQRRTDAQLSQQAIASLRQTCINFAVLRSRHWLLGHH